MFGKIKKSPKELYEEEIEKLRDKEFALGNYILYHPYIYTFSRGYYTDEEIQKYINRCFSVSYEEYKIIMTDEKYLNIKFNNKLLGEVEYLKGDRLQNNKFALALDKELKQKKIEKELEEKRKLQLKEDGEYLEKYNELLKIKPLDNDLKETFKKANRIVEIGKEIIKLTSELNKIRK